MDEYLEYVGEVGIEVFDDVDDEDLDEIELVKEEIEFFDLIDMSVLLGVKINDFVCMYLKEIG